MDGQSDATVDQSTTRSKLQHTCAETNDCEAFWYWDGRRNLSNGRQK